MTKEKEAENFYHRIIFITTVSVVLAHSLHLRAPNFIAIMTANMVIAIRNYEAKPLAITLASFYLGMFAGFILTEIFMAFPLLQVLLTYIIFLTALIFFLITAG